MVLFKKQITWIFDKFINYKPKFYQLGIDQKNQLNILNIQTLEPLYKDNPQEICKEQVQGYTKAPSYLAPIPLPMHEKNLCFAQHKTINNLLNGIKFTESRISMTKQIGLIIVIGSGMGFHLLELIEHTNVQHLIIIDPEPDLFYASLYHIDWSALALTAAAKKTTLHLLEFKDNETIVDSIRNFILINHLQHHLANSFYFNHLDTMKTKAIYEQIKHEISFLFMNNGFLEDEQIGLAHSYHNMMGTHLFFTADAHTDHSSKIPVFIIANGPSLEDALPFIKKNIDNVILMSCGSALGTLYNNQIQPDFHFEMERSYDTYQHLIDINDAQYLSSIKIIALNTVAPEVLSLFKQSFLVLKDRDTFIEIINSISSNTIPVLTYMNPTVSNFAVSFSLVSQFQALYLLGVDLGMKNPSEHHAKSSNYYKTDTKLGTDQLSNRIESQIKGNFQESVWTYPTFDYSRINIIRAIQAHAKKGQIIYNLSDGVYIKGTIPKHMNQLEFSRINNKEEEILQLCKQLFKPIQRYKEINPEIIKKNFLREALEFLTSAKLPEQITSLDHLYNLVNERINKMKEIKSFASLILIDGGFGQIYLILLQIAYQLDTEKQLQLIYPSKAKKLNKFMDFAHRLLEQHTLMTDKERRSMLSQWIEES
jgi:hypothetical protein